MTRLDAKTIYLAQQMLSDGVEKEQNRQPLDPDYLR
jgi:hypothetical protein